MAEDYSDWLAQYGAALDAAEKPPEAPAGWLDVPKEIGASIAGTIAAPLGAAQVATATSSPDASDIFGGLSMAAHATEQALRSSQSEVSRRAAEATIIPEEGKAWAGNTPIRSLAMQGAGLAGPGVLLMGAAMVAPEGFLAGLVTDAAAGGVLGVSQVADKAAQFYNDPELTDKKLAAQDPRFAMLTEQGVDPKEARNMRMQEVVRDAPLFANGLAGALGMGVGGRVIRGATGGSGGLISRMALGAGENAVGMAGMSAAGTYADQDLEIAQGKRTDYDYRKMWLAGAQGAAIGGVVGTVGGVLHRPDGRRLRDTDTRTNVERVDELGVGTDAAAAMSEEPVAPPAPTIDATTLAAPGSKSIEPAQPARIEPTESKAQSVDPDIAEALTGKPTQVTAPVEAPATPVVHPGEPETPVAAVVHAPEVAPEAEKITPDTALQGAGKGIVEGLYDTLWGKVQAGDITEGGGISALLQAAKRVRAKGGLQTPEEFKTFAQEQANVARGPGFQGRMRELVNKYTPEKTAPEKTAPEVAPEAAPEPAAPAGIGPEGRRILETGPRWGEGSGSVDLGSRMAENLKTAGIKIAKATREERGKTEWQPHEIAQQNKNHEIAKRLLDATPAFEPIKKNEEATRAPIRNRLQEIISDALASGVGVHTREKGQPFENRIPERVDAMPGEVIWLREVERMLKKFQRQRAPSKTDINDFIAIHDLARAGKWDDIREKRKTEGESYGEARRKASVKEAPKSEESAAGDVGERADVSTAGMSPEDRLLQREDVLEHGTAEDIEKVAEQEAEPTQEPPSRERPVVETEGPAYTAVKARTAPVAAARGRSRFEGMRPKVVEKIKLAEKLNKETNAREPLKELKPEEKKVLKDQVRWLPGAGTSLEERLAAKQAETNRRVVQVDPDQGDSQVAHKVYTLKEVLNKLPNLKRKDFENKIPQALYRIAKNRMLKHAGDVDVKIVTHAQMDRLTYKDPRRTDPFTLKPDPSAPPPLGYYDHEHNQLVIRDDVFSDAYKANRVVIHEGMHAAYVKAMMNDPFLEDLTNRLIDHIQERIDKDPELTAGMSEREVNSLTYGLLNADEFVAEAFSNEAFQHLLATMKMPRTLARELGLRKTGTVWDHFVDMVRRALGIPAGSKTHVMLEGAIRIVERVDETKKAMDESPFMNEDPFANKGKAISPEDLDGLMKEMERLGVLTPKEEMRKLAFLPDTMSPEAADRTRSEWGRFVTHTGENLGQIAADPIQAVQRSMTDLAMTGSGMASTMGRLIRKVENNYAFAKRVEPILPGVRKVVSYMERKGTRAKELMKDGMKISQRMVALQKKMPGAFEDFADLVHRATMFGVDPASRIGEGRNKYLELSQDVQKKLAKGMSFESVIHEVNKDHIEAVSNWKELNNRYNELMRKDPEFGKLMDDTFSYFHDAQQDMTRNHLQAVLRGVLKGDAGAEHVVKRRADELLNSKKTDELHNQLIEEFKGSDGTEEQRRTVGEGVADTIFGLKSVSGREGPYAPLMRHGDWALVGKYKIKAPTNAIQKIGTNAFEFKTRKEASDFARSTGLHFDLNTAYYDPLTGDKTTKLGGVSTAGGPEQRWVARLNDTHVEFHESKKSALKAYEQHKNNPLFESVNQPEIREQMTFLEGEMNARGMNAVIRKLHANERYQTANHEQQKAMQDALREASLMVMGGNKMQSRRLPRRRIEGYSDDLLGNFDIYNRSQANFRAKQEWQPNIDAALQEVNDTFKQGKYIHPDDPRRTKQSEYVREINERVRARNPDEYTGQWAEFTRQLSTWNYIYRMGRVSHLLLHQMHLPMITAPTLAGRHGLFKTYATIFKTWKDLAGAYKEGAFDVKGALKDTLHDGTDYGGYMRDRIKNDADAVSAGKMLTELEQEGVLHPQYEVDIKQAAKQRAMLSPMRMMNYFDVAFRHATNATEAINRYVGALSAYRLEFARLTREGVPRVDAHERATQFAKDTVANTQGVYTASNAAPLFKNPIMRPFLQFKQFPAMIYNLMATNVLKAMDRNASKQERVQAAASFGYLIAAHSIATGLLGGLPLETAKVGGLVTKGLGITEGDWSDVERWQYDQMVKLFGKEGAMYMMHGLSRGIGIDAHHRLGLNSFFTFGLPEGSENNATNIWAFLAQQMLGAPGGLATDALRATHKIMSGDLGGGAAQLAPQQIRDIYKAWNGGGKDYKYTGGERAARVLGFTPSGEAEYYERRTETRSQNEQYIKGKNQLFRGWQQAETGADKATVWAKVQKFNQGRSKNEQITLKQLTDAAKRRKEDEKKGNVVYGVRLSKQTKSIGERAAAIY